MSLIDRQGDHLINRFLMIQITEGTGPLWCAGSLSFDLEKNLEASDPGIIDVSQDSRCSSGVVLRLEELVETLQDRRRRTDQVLRRQRPDRSGDGDQADVRPQEGHPEVPGVFWLDCS